MAAEAALIDLLVDTQTAEAVEAWDDGFPSIPPAQPSHNDPSGDCLPAAMRARSSQSINQEAAAADPWDMVSFLHIVGQSPTTV